MFFTLIFPLTMRLSSILTRIRESPSERGLSSLPYSHQLSSEKELLPYLAFVLSLHASALPKAQV
jgi:hypothetical protein